MKTRIFLTGILRNNDLFLAVKRSENDTKFPGAHLESDEDKKTINESVKKINWILKLFRANYNSLY